MPNADQAVEIANALDSSVEYLVTGINRDQVSMLPHHIQELINTTQELSESRQHEILGVVRAYIQTNFKKIDDSVTEEKIG